MDILDRIQTGYEDFSVQQEKIVKKYPIGVHQEFDKYDQNLLKFFGISRKNPEVRLRLSKYLPLYHLLIGAAGKEEKRRCHQLSFEAQRNHLD